MYSANKETIVNLLTVGPRLFGRPCKLIKGPSFQHSHGHRLIFKRDTPIILIPKKVSEINDSIALNITVRIPRYGFPIFI